MSNAGLQGQPNPLLIKAADDLNRLRGRAKQLGAIAGEQRIELLLRLYDELDLQDSYHLLDLNSMQQEIEDAGEHSRHLTLIQSLRHIASLVPLIWTWWGLLQAVNSYQSFISTHRGVADQQLPFLTLWQDGFHHTTGLTFGATATVTILCLIFYLCMILISQYADRRNQAVAAEFIREVSGRAKIFIELALRSRIVTVTNPDDVKTIAQAIKQVIDGAIAETKQVVQEAQAAVQRIEAQAQRALKDSNGQFENILNGQVKPLLQTFDDNTTAFGQRIDGLQDLVSELVDSTDTMQESAKHLLNDVNLNHQLGTEIDSHLQALRQGEQAVAEQLRDMTAQVSSASNGMTQASTQVGRAATSLETTNQQIDQGFQTTLARMTVSDQNAATFQTELQAFHTQLDDFRETLQDLISTSNELGGSMHTYTNLGEQIQQQVAALAQSESAILAQFRDSSISLGTVTGNIASAATAMGQTKDSLVGIAQGLNQNTQAALSLMVGDIGRATRSLGDVEKQLSGTSNALLQVTNQLAALPQAVPQFAPLQQTVSELAKLQKTLGTLAAALQAQNQGKASQASTVQDPWWKIFTPGANRSRTGGRP